MVYNSDCRLHFLFTRQFGHFFSAPPSQMDPSEAQYYDDMAQGLAAEQAAVAWSSTMPVQALPNRPYLEATVLPLLLLGLEAVAAERPDDPLEFLAAYLVSNNPQREPVLPLPPGCLFMAGAQQGMLASQSQSAIVATIQHNATVSAPV